MYITVFCRRLVDFRYEVVFSNDAPDWSVLSEPIVLPDKPMPTKCDSGEGFVDSSTCLPCDIDMYSIGDKCKACPNNSSTRGKTGSSNCVVLKKEGKKYSSHNKYYLLRNQYCIHCRMIMLYSFLLVLLVFSQLTLS